MTPSPRQSPKEKKLKLAKIYVLQCTLYVQMNVHLRFKKKFITDVENYSGLYLAAQAAPLPPPQRDGPGILICGCVTSR
jgi:hypothetical protein